jgi:molybdenum cofactor cytidylyltransferase
VAALLLAAGLSTRMGARNKLLIEIGGEPLVRRVAQAYLAAGAALYAVTGHEAARVAAAFGGLPLTFIGNPRYADGQASSLHAGLRGMPDGHDAVLIALADQAALTGDDIGGLIRTFASGDRTRALIPFYRGKRGNPVLFPREIAARLLAEPGEASGRDFLAAHPELARRYEAPNDHFVIDIDTPADLDAFAIR